MDAHENGFLVGVGEGKDEFSEEVAAVAAAEPGEGCWATGGDFGAFADCDEEVVG